MAIDLKKEIKLSDLFKRTPKEAPPPQPKAQKPPKPPKGRKPLFGRGGGGKQQVAAVVGAQPALPLPDIPLMRPFNLLPEEEEQRGGSRVGLVQVGVALGGIVLAAALGALYLFSSASVTEKRSTAEDLRAELAQISVPKKQAGAGRQAELASEQKSRADALSKALARRVPLDRLLRDFGLVLPADVWLDGLTVTTPEAAGEAEQPAAPTPASGGETVAPTAFTITGYTKEQAGVAELLSRLSVLPELTSVTLLSASASDDPENPTVQFSISADLRTEVTP